MRVLRSLVSVLDRKSLIASATCIGLSLVLAGCGQGIGAAPGAGIAPEAGVIDGKAFGGYSPVVGGTATLYQSQNNGYGGAGAVIATTTTDSNGAFGFTTGATCTTGSVIYVVISGGNSGAAAANSQILEIAPVETCGAGAVTVAATTIVNELSTVASAYALGNFLSINTSGASPVVNMSAPPNNNYSATAGAATPTGATCTSGATFIANGSNNVSNGTTCTASGLQHAYTNVGNLVNYTVNSGSANTTVPANTSVTLLNVATPSTTNSSTVPARLINTIAGVLQSCVNSQGGTAGINFSVPTPATSGAGSQSNLVLANSTASISGSLSITVNGTSVSGSVSGVGASALASSISSISGFSAAGLTASSVGNTVTITGPTGTVNTLTIGGSLSGSATSSTAASFTALSSPSATAGASSILNGFSGSSSGVNGSFTATLAGTPYTSTISGATTPSAFVSAFNSTPAFTNATPTVAFTTVAPTATALGTTALNGFNASLTGLNGTLSVQLGSGALNSTVLSGITNQAGLISALNSSSSFNGALPNPTLVLTTANGTTTSGVWTISGFNGTTQGVNGNYSFNLGGTTYGPYAVTSTTLATLASALNATAANTVIPTYSYATTGTTITTPGQIKLSGFTTTNSTFTGFISFKYLGTTYTTPTATYTLTSLITAVNALASNTVSPFINFVIGTAPSNSIFATMTISGLSTGGGVNGLLSITYAGAVQTHTIASTSASTFVSSFNSQFTGMTAAVTGTAGITITANVASTTNTIASPSMTITSATNTVMAITSGSTVEIIGPTGVLGTTNALSSQAVTVTAATNTIFAAVSGNNITITTPSGTATGNSNSVGPTFTPTSATNTLTAAETSGGVVTITGPDGVGNIMTPTFTGVTAVNSLLASTYGANQVLITGPSGTANSLSFSGSTITSNVQPATDGSVCGQLFTVTPDLNGNIPTNTLQAAMNMAKNPFVSTANVSAVYNLLSAQPAFLPTLTAAPHDWTIAISYLIPEPYSVGVEQSGGFPWMIDTDADDNVYTATSPAAQDGTTLQTIACIVSYGPDGTLRSGTGDWGCNAVSGKSAYLEVEPDALGNLWSVNYNGSGTSAASYGVFQFSSTNGTVSNGGTEYAPTTGTTRLFAQAIDKNNNIYVNNNSTSSTNPTVTYIANTFTTSNSWAVAQFAGATASAPHFSGSAHNLALDISGNIWAAEYGSASGTDGGAVGVIPSVTTAPTYQVTTTPVQQISIAGGSVTAVDGNSSPYGVAVDANGNVWTGNGNQDNFTGPIEITEIPAPAYPISSLPTTGTTFANAGITQPRNMEVDGANNLWVTDGTGYHEITNLSGTPTEISQGGGFQTCYLGYANTSTSCIQSWSIDAKNLTIDAAGDVWTLYPTTSSNAGSIAVGRAFEIIGTAFPTWPLHAQQVPGFPAGCTKSLAAGCN